MSFIIGLIDLFTVIAVKRKILSNAEELVAQRKKTFSCKIAVIDGKIMTIQADLKNRESEGFKSSLSIASHMANEAYIEQQRDRLAALLVQRQEMVDEELAYQKQMVNNIYRDN